MSRATTTTRALEVEMERELVEAERAACAELVRAAGCLCHLIPRDPRMKGSPRKVHDPRCPHALANSIEARGRA